MQNKEKLDILRHSAAHLMAQAISQLYPTTKLTLGPPTAEGFFYDCQPQEENFKEHDLPLIEERMHELAKQDIPITHKQISKEEARKIFHDNPFKLEMIDLIPDETVGLAEQGEFKDLCRGGHVDSTSEIKNFKLLNISGSYWRADRNGTPLQRLSGTAFFTEKELEAYLQRLEDLKQYDHRRLGKQMELFSFHEEGPGFPFFLPKGRIVYNIMMDYMRKILRKYDHEEISTPGMLSVELWKQSGHYDHYKENMYFSEIDEKEFAIKPMNCPGSILVYKERPRSYRELPLRLAELGYMHRHELSGVLNGLFRVRSFLMDDAHIYCTSDQIESEVLSLITMINEVLNKFGFDNVDIALSTRPEKAMGTDEMWENAEKSLSEALNKSGIKYKIQEGDGAFYGPKIDFKIKDSMDREWQCSTIQVDFNNPENFDLSYINSEGKKERPVMIHRAIYGSFERFYGIILEHYKGNFPFWLAPVQVQVLTITDAANSYAKNIAAELKKADIRVKLDDSSDQISGKIKAAQLAKVPWMLIIGKKEEQNNTVSVRYQNGKQEQGLSLEKVIEKAHELNKY
ncbi:threonine--tRNA ligase [bacterium]|jgi:threonyl-tRNA synthetase|nr:threonine--tRNA ligase [bacterium]MBT5015289.1 threonine--tRNA ligase [bacterium]